ncbi:hypothetical protein GCM10009609_19850 [Pseudonocardia aurantiaca]
MLMRSVYRVLAYLVALEVVIQAAAVAFAVSGLTNWIENGGVLDAAVMQSETIAFNGVIGFIVHGLNGQIIVPLIALLLLISSFFAKIPGGVLWAGLVFLTVVVQVFLGMFAGGIPELGILHGIGALALFAFAVVAARRAEAATSGLEPRASRGTADVA